MKTNTTAYFAVPNVQEHWMLWQKTLPATIDIEGDISIEKLAHQYELSGASILNIVYAASIHTLVEGAADFRNGFDSYGLKLIKGMNDYFPKYNHRRHSSLDKQQPKEVYENGLIGILNSPQN